MADARHYIVEVPGAESDPAFRFAGIGDEQFVPNEHAATTIEEAMAYTGVRDQASVTIAEFLRTGTVSQAHRVQLWRIIASLALPTDALTGALLDEQDQERYDRLQQALNAYDWGTLEVLNAEGLVVSLDKEGQLRPVLESDPSSAFGVDSEEFSLSMELDATDITFRDELVWREGVPSLLSDRQHYVLGRLAADGTYEEVTTILPAEPYVQT